MIHKIPKIIHYCWFGRNPKPSLVLKCMESWKQHLSDYQFIEWNEDNFDLNINNYTKQAYDCKKWAFVTDYVRLYALKNHGGIYLDSDVEVFKSLNKFLEHSAFSGFENFRGHLSPITAIMGSEKDGVWVSNLLQEYEHKNFIGSDNQMDLTTNTKTITAQLINEYNIKINDSYQVVGDDIHIYPSDYFCNNSKNSYSLHHFNGSWIPKKRKILSKIKRFLLSLVDK
ncbi:MAG: hypothetical protein RLZZ210_259 [Pseudomonadota bacterium]|jgi:mannosyltransferase OCH1-like enzyme